MQELGKGTYFEVEIEGLKDYTVFSDRGMLPGTTVTLELRSDIVIDDLYELATNQVLCSEIPIEFKIDSEIACVPDSVPDVDDKFLLGPKFDRRAELGIEIFKWRGGIGEIEIALSLAYRRAAGRPTFLEQGAPILFSGPEGRIHFPISAICGFRGTFFNPTSLCFDLPRVGAVHINCKSPQGFEYAIDRQGLLENDTQRNATAASVDLIHSGYREFLCEAGAFNAETIYQLNNESLVGGGNVSDICTRARLAEMYSGCPDLLCFKLIVVGRVVPSNVHEVRYFDAAHLAKQKGTAWVAQKPVIVPKGGLQHVGIHPENMIGAVYQYAQARLFQCPGEEFFVLEPNALASMLFDCDPESTVEFFPVAVPIDSQKKVEVEVPIQKINLANVRFTGGAQGILAEVQGKWTGAIYSREFNNPNGRPYLFLGMHRVLVKPSSPLWFHLEDLKREARFRKIADTVALLKQHEAGYSPTELSGLLS